MIYWKMCIYIYEKKVVLLYQDAYLYLCFRGEETSYMHDFQINVWPVWNSILNLHYSRKGVNNMQAKIPFEHRKL